MMKSDLFNSTFEMELRVAVLLSEGAEQKFSVDRILAMDFITCYGKVFRFSDSNLHGDNSYMYSELSNRRALIQEAVKPLVYRGIIAATVSNGYLYQITDAGLNYVNSLESEYAQIYRSIAKEVIAELGNMTDEELMNAIHSKSIMDRNKGAK